MTVSSVLLALLLILWGLSLTGLVAVPGVLLGILALITGIVMFVERFHPIKTL